MKFKLNMYKLKEGRDMKADTFSKLVATTLYERRYDIWLSRRLRPINLSRNLKLGYTYFRFI